MICHQITLDGVKIVTINGGNNMKSKIELDKIKKMRDKKMSFSEIGKVMGTSKQNVHELLNRPRRYTMEEFWKSLYWEVESDDGEFDGYIHVVSTIDGSEIKIKLTDFLSIGKGDE